MQSSFCWAVNQKISQKQTSTLVDPVLSVSLYRYSKFYVNHYNVRKLQPSSSATLFASNQLFYYQFQYVSMLECVSNKLKPSCNYIFPQTFVKKCLNYL